MDRTFVIYVLLVVFGSLCLIGAPIYKYLDDRRSAVERKQLEERRHQEVIDLVTEARRTLKEGYQQMRDDLEGVGQLDPALAKSLDDRAATFASVDDRLAAVLREAPKEMRAELQRKAAISGAEAQAIRRAESLDRDLRPRVVATAGLIRATILKSAKAGLVHVDSIGDSRVPARTMFSANELVGKTRALHDEGMVVRFSDDTAWNVFVELGYVKSPPELTPWSEATDVWYPMIRIEENARGSMRMLATLYFEPNNTSLSINPNDATSATKANIEELKKRFVGNELIANALLELLKETRVRSVGG